MNYAEPHNERQALDVYKPASPGKNRPIAFWIHGGGWQKGDKSGVKTKPRMFTDEGFLFVATNYRYTPNVTVGEQAGDVAKAIRWTFDHAEEYGGDRNSFVVAGHSAGAQLAALIATDERYLAAEGLTLSILKACVPVDADTYDAPLQIATVNERSRAVYTWKFGDAESQRALSPITHVAPGKGIPPIAVLHVATHPETKVQSERFVSALRQAGLKATAIAATDTDHVKLNDNLGLAGDKPTAAVLEFVRGCLPK
jgi:acetyl esterase/lipase